MNDGYPSARELMDRAITQSGLEDFGQPSFVEGLEMLLESLAATFGAGALGAVLTGMGDDGARGLRALKDAGGRTLAQDEASCTVFGMPREAIRRDSVDEVMPLTQISQRIMDFAGGKLRKRKVV